MSTSKPKIGIALSGGVIRGFAHVGVLQVLDEANIDISYVGGSSVGSLVGYFVAAGLSIDQISQYAPKISWQRVARPVLPKTGFISFASMESWFTELIGDLHFSDLAKPFVVSTTDLQTGEPVLFRHGRVAEAVRISCSVPGLAEPTVVNGRILGDGGVSKNTPAQAVRDLGADYVIGVDVFYPTYRQYAGPFAGGIAAIEIMFQRSGNGREEADHLIIPNLEGQPLFDPRKQAQLIQIGREAAQEQLPTILQEIESLSPN